MPCDGGRGFLLAAHRTEDQTGASTQGRIIGHWFAGNFGGSKNHRCIVVTATQFSILHWLIRLSVIFCFVVGKFVFSNHRSDFLRVGVSGLTS